MNPALENRQDAIMRNISASCFAASFIVLFWCIFLSRHCHDYGIFLVSPRSPRVPGALQLQLSAGCACGQLEEKKKRRNKKTNPQHATSRICPVKFLMIARLPRFCRQAGREGGMEGGRRDCEEHTETCRGQSAVHCEVY